MPSEAPPSALVANKYEIVRLVGRGGMGAVWEGRHVTLGTRVAVKFIDSEFADRPDVQKRFETEAKSAATIQSKHAIQIFDHGIGEDGRPYIVMEYLEGEPLDARLARVGTMELPAITRILQQVSRALAKAHERGIVHRDLKPENIFLVQTLEDDEEIAKVLDFGIAKIVGDQAGPLTGATKTGAILGTPFYMSPEQARGLKEVDHRADIWSLGVIAFRAVVGRLPFDGQSVGDLLVNICTADPPVPSAMRAGLPPSFDAWIKRSLARALDDRFANVGEQMEMLALSAGVTVKRPISSQAGVPSSALGNADKYKHTLPLDSSRNSSAPSPLTPAPGQTPVSAATPLPVGNVTSTSLSTSTSGLPRQAARTRWTLIGTAMVLLTLGSGALLVLFLWKNSAPETPAAATASFEAAATPSAAPSTALPALDPLPAASAEPTAKVESALSATPAATPPAKTGGKAGKATKPATPPPTGAKADPPKTPAAHGDNKPSPLGF